MTVKQLREKAREKRRMEVYWKITARARELEELIISIIGLFIVLVVIAVFKLLTNGL